jgi:hypothetical protein
MVCSECGISEKCPAFVEDAVCEYEKGWRKFSPMRNKELVLINLEEVIKEKTYRYNRARAFEDKDGGYLDKTVSQLENDLAKLIQMYNDIKFPHAMVEMTKNETVNIVSMQQLINQLPEKYDEVREKWANWQKKKASTTVS